MLSYSVVRLCLLPFPWQQLLPFRRKLPKQRKNEDSGGIKKQKGKQAHAGEEEKHMTKTKEKEKYASTGTNICEKPGQCPAGWYRLYL